jgi:hypothetical protein
MAPSSAVASIVGGVRAVVVEVLAAVLLSSMLIFLRKIKIPKLFNTLKF